LTLSVRYRPSVLVAPDGLVHTTARQFSTVRLSSTVTLTQAVKAHTTMLAQIGEYFRRQRNGH
jgi:hypothetical protein